MIEGQSISEKIRKHNAEFEKDKVSMSADRTKAERMMAVFTGFDDGGYDPATRSQLKAEGKHLPQFNIVKEKIRKVAGNLVKDFLDKDFVPLSGDDTNSARIIKGAYLSDKAHFEYDESYTECALNGLIHQGIEYLYVDTKFNAIGNLAFRSLVPSSIIVDPNWKTNKSSDIQVVWVVKYLTAQQIKQIYGHKSARIDELIVQEELHGMIRDVDNQSVMPYKDNLDSYGSLHRIVEKHYMEVVGRDAQYVITDIEGKSTVEEGNADVLDDDPAQVRIERRVYTKTYKIQTSCITLDPEEFLEDREAEMQIERLPFFPWSAERMNGTNCGKVEGLEDAQITLNKRERLATSIMESSAHGAHLIDPILFGSDMTLARQAVADFNKSDAKIFTAPGALATNQRLIQEVPKTQFQGEVYEDINRMNRWIDQLSGQTASMDGRKESSHDTGTLMEQRVVQSNVAQTLLYKSLQIHELQKAEAWLSASRKLYTGTYREFFPAGSGFKDKGEILRVNDRIFVGDDVETMNDFAKLPPFKVTIKQSKQGVSVREHDRAVGIDALSVIQSPIKRLVIENDIMTTLTDSSEQREKIEEIGELELQVAVEELGLRVANVRFQKEQMQQQLAGADQQAAAQEQQMQAQAQQQQQGQPQVA